MSYLQTDLTILAKNNAISQMNKVRRAWMRCSPRPPPSKHANRSPLSSHPRQVRPWPAWMQPSSAPIQASYLSHSFYPPRYFSVLLSPLSSLCHSTKLIVWWDSLSMIEKRVGANKEMLVLMTEQAIQSQVRRAPPLI